MKTVWMVVWMVAAAGLFAQEPPHVTAEQRQAIVDSVAQAVDSIYVFPETGRKMADKIRAQQASGAYDKLLISQEFGRAVTEDLRSISHDLHVSLSGLPIEQGASLSPDELAAQIQEEHRQNNYGFREVKLLPGNIGYVKLDGFVPADMAGPTAIAALNLVGNSDALIFDLRENGGGDPSMIQLICSYLFDTPTHLNDFFLRADSSIQQFWTQAAVSGLRLTTVPVYVLTSQGTFSAAEEFAYDLQQLKRGTIVGQPSGGGAHPNQFVRFASLGCQLSVPFGRAINPVSHTNWEGVGVKPDLECEAGDALEVAQLAALKQLREKTTLATRIARLDWQIEGLEARRQPYQPKAGELNQFAGQYGPRKVTLEQGLLMYQREQNPKRRLIPLSKNLFGLEGVDYFRVVFITDSQGRVTGLEGHYDDGHTDQNPRGG